jgi:hypothetical protein
LKNTTNVREKNLLFLLQKIELNCSFWHIFYCRVRGNGV